MAQLAYKREWREQEGLRSDGCCCRQIPDNQLAPRMMAKPPCGFCHGNDLRGPGPVPALAGHSPSYLVRQLYDLQSGTRKGLWSGLMQQVVAQLSLENFVAIGAYVASLDP